MKVLVQEKTGTKLSAACNYADPFTPKFCSRKDCFPCKTGEKPTRGTCWRTGATYSIECRRCARRGIKAVYWGESGFSSHYRGKQHLSAFRRSQQDSALVKHVQDCHQGEEEEMDEDDFVMKTVQTHGRPLTCQCQEGLLLKHSVKGHPGWGQDQAVKQQV